MVTFKDILYQMEERFETCVQEKALRILNSEFFENIDKPRSNIAESNLFYLKNYLYGSDKQEVLFQLLEDSGFNAYSEIKHFIRELFVHRDIFLDDDAENQFAISRYINSPYIQSIERKGWYFEVESNQLGRYSFLSTEEYFKDDEWVIFYLRNAKLEGRCHENVEFLTERYPKLYSITSLCESMFEGNTYYHSYCYDSDTDNVIDLCSKLVMSKDMYDRLFRTEEIFSIQGKSLPNASKIALKYNRGLKHYFKPMICTLFQQYIWENNFATPDSGFYSEEPSNDKILIKNRMDKVVGKNDNF